jgi:purine-cytosine permease-like protein
VTRALIFNTAMEEKHYISSIISVLVGCALLMWRKQFAAAVAREQNRMWGFHFGQREERISLFMAIIVGIGFLTIGILGLLGLIYWKPGTL